MLALYHCSGKFLLLVHIALMQLCKYSYSSSLVERGQYCFIQHKLDSLNFPPAWVLPIVDLTDPTLGDALRR